MIKLIALDLDNTLLQPDKTVSDVDRDALIKAQEMGIYVVIASGRWPGSIKKIADVLKTPSSGYCVAFNGAQVSSIDEKEIISYRGLKGSDLKYLAALKDEYKVHMHAFDYRGCFSEEDSKYTTYEVTINNIKLHLVKYNEFDDDADIIKIMFVDEPEILDEAIAKFPKELYEKYNIVKSAGFFLEFLNPAADKWYGIMDLADKLNIKQDEIMTFGDETNDYLMIKNAGLGIAMGNAIDKIKEVSKYVTLKNEENGVAYALNKFIFNK